MSMNNSSICQKPDLFWQTASMVHFVSTNIVLPIYALLGLGGHIVLLLALWKQSKNEEAYAYQIFLVVNETLETISFVFYSLNNMWGGLDGDGAGWYLSKYGLMWMTGHLAIPLSEWMSVNSLLLSVSMSADRAFALTKPFHYKNINHRRHQIVAVVTSTLCSMLCNLYNLFLFNVERRDDGMYVIIPNMAYLEGALSNGLSYLCSCVRIVGLAALIAGNILIVRMFHTRQSHVSKMTQRNQSNEERSKKLNEKTLVQLTVCQSTFVAISTFSEVSFYTAAYVIPNFNACESLLLAPILDAVLQLSALANTFTPFLISKQCRIMVIKAIPCLANICGANTVQVTNSRLISVSGSPVGT